MSKETFCRLTVLSLFVMCAPMLSLLTKAQSIEAPSTKRTLALTAIGPAGGSFGRTGQSGVVVIKAKNGRTTLKYSVSGLRPNAVHGVWLILDTSQPPFVPGSSPLLAADSATGTTAAVFDFTPEAADDGGFTGGNGLDPNGFITDADGNANFTIELNYDIFQPAVAPVVLAVGTSQMVEVSSAFGSPPGPCVGSSGSEFAAQLDSAYMRMFDTSRTASPPATSPGFQVTDAPARAKLVRANVKAVVVVDHFDGLTHGHLPGINVSGSGCGDFAGRLRGMLADATP